MGFCISCQNSVASGKFCPTCGKQLVDVVFEEQAAAPAGNVSKGGQGMWAHLGAIIGVLAGYFTFITWFVLWLPGLLIRRSSTATDFDKAHATESFNFQLSSLVLLGFFLLGDLALFIVGTSVNPDYFAVLSAYAIITLLIMWLVSVMGFIFAIIGSIAASKLKEYRYPISFRFVK